MVCDVILIVIYLFAQEYFHRKNEEAMSSQRDLDSIRKKDTHSECKSVNFILNIVN
jgi:hypothetical protein